MAKSHIRSSPLDLSPHALVKSATTATAQPQLAPSLDPKHAAKTPAQQRAIVHNAAIGDCNQTRKLADFWLARGPEAAELAAAYERANAAAEQLVAATRPPAESSDPLALMLTCVRTHAARHKGKGNWDTLAGLEDADLASVIAGAKTVAGAVMKAGIAAKAVL